MTVNHIPYHTLSHIAYKDLTYIESPEKLADFYAYTPDFEGISHAIRDRQSFPVDRSLLVDVLERQYSLIQPETVQIQNIRALARAETFTVVTAHQPCLFTGPAYYFYKIFSAITLCHRLAEQHPGHQFVPVFISGSEDHDVEEINHLSIFGNQLVWETTQRGPVGRFSVEGLEDIIRKFSELLGNRTHAGEIRDLLQQSLYSAAEYNDFVFQMLNRIFGRYGLIVFNMDDPELKKRFIPVMERELLERPSEKLVWETQEALLQFQFKPQAYPRDINLFYMQPQSRERIYFEKGMYHINNTTLSFTEAEIIRMLHTQPENFSPNVVLRPLYQEYILPNIAYIGGGGENAYWLERKRQFAFFNVFFPVIIRRNSAMIIAGGQLKQMQKLGLEWSDFLLEENKIITRYLEKSSDTDFHLNQEIADFQKIFSTIAGKARNIDPTLEQYVLGEGAKTLKSIEHIEARLKKTLKQKEEIALQQIHSLKEKLFPHNNLQERSENFFQYIAMYGFDWMDELLPYFDPMKREFSVFFV